MFTRNSLHRPVRLIVAVQVIGLLVAACGGGGGGGGNMSSPAATMSIQPTSIVLGRAATLTWSSTAATACAASGAWSGAEALSGTQQVQPTAAGTLTYTLTCTGSGKRTSTVSATLTVTPRSAFTATKLLTDTAGTGALATDANLVNAWGLAFGPTTFAWVANNHTETSTLYDGNGKRQPAAAPLVVKLSKGASGASFDPTGIVFNGGTGFVITSAGKSGPARFIFDGEGGMIGGWASSVDSGNVVTMYVDAGNAVYKGLAIAKNGGADFLYATDFHNNKIDVFDSSFKKQPATAASFGFVDPTLPAGYAPFGIQAIANGAGGATQLYVSYAKQEAPDNFDNANGAGLGLVNIFDTNGNLVKHLVPVGGVLDGPWGMALAPADFGTLSNTLLVGNFGDGRINAFDPASGQFIGTVQDAGGAPFSVPGLWGIAFGNDAANQPHNTLFYAAGTNDEASGEYGRIDLGSTPPVLNAPPVVSVTTPAGNLSGIVAVTATVKASVGVAKVEFFANGASIGAATSSPYAVQWDTTKVANGAVSLTATATDVDGNVGTSPAATVTVANGAAAVTLAQIQAQVFTPRCSGCHNGSNPPGGALPGSQNLTAGNSFASLVNVASLEKAGLLRVKPGDAANSYLIQKLEGAAGISGSRMPLGGPFLDQATIDLIKSWIASGAPNN